MPKEQERKAATEHLHGVALYCALLARKRRENEELALIAGLLHDVYRCATLQSQDHAHKGAAMSREILNEFALFTESELAQISTAIYNHSDKLQVHTAFDEILKDADVMEHVFSQPLASVQSNEQERYDKLVSELGL
jgi:putative nucleotidyltransferase with HDIG domain